MDISVFIWPVALTAVMVFLFLCVYLFFILASRQSKSEVEIELPYRTKAYFFTKSEQQFLRVLNESIDRQKYTIFPKVRLADFVEVTTGKEEYQSWWNKIRSKHVDFLIWNIADSKIALAIELDGKSHQTEKVVASDAFKDNLYRKINIPLHRIKVGTDFKSEISKII